MNNMSSQNLTKLPDKETGTQNRPQRLSYAKATRRPSLIRDSLKTPTGRKSATHSNVWKVGGSPACPSLFFDFTSRPNTVLKYFVISTASFLTTVEYASTLITHVALSNSLSPTKDYSKIKFMGISFPDNQCILPSIPLLLMLALYTFSLVIYPLPQGTRYQMVFKKYFPTMATSSTMVSFAIMILTSSWAKAMPLWKLIMPNLVQPDYATQLHGPIQTTCFMLRGQKCRSIAFIAIKLVTLHLHALIVLLVLVFVTGHVAAQAIAPLSVSTVNPNLIHPVLRHHLCLIHLRRNLPTAKRLISPMKTNFDLSSIESYNDNIINEYIPDNFDDNMLLPTPQFTSGLLRHIHDTQFYV
ncbi:hypothetical protein O0I10_001439 [Lichtheimia ornata]|uniref:Uncharacterized protein n=1 Tax=Lichtheimia ornata TaxID=688661 RepID=A0AAD7XZ12_9FUNG|nr:uncharacterized protein O0I10_001439 [Lichtheimia ornata]KAJ8662479.1 hypothetical protein O0I10_001439 [Lichtheimia ornata]